MKKALIFGLGKQWRKYISFFTERGYKIVGVSKTGKYLGSTSLFLVYSFHHIQSQKQEFFQQFDIGIVSILPIEEQEKVLHFLLSKNIWFPCIIEKPICFSKDLQQQLLWKSNFTFFNDEYILEKLFCKIFPNFQDIAVCIADFWKARNSDMLQHALGGFLWFSDVDFSRIHIMYDSEKESDDVRKFILKNGTYTFMVHKSDIFLNGKHIGKMHFSQSLEKIIQMFSTSSEKHILYKRNYISLLSL